MSKEEKGFLNKIKKYIINSYENNRMTLEEYLEDYSKKIDKAILDIEKEEQATYITGEASFSAFIDGNQDKVMKIKIDLYFQKTEEDYINYPILEELKNKEIEWVLKDEAIEQLIKEAQNFDIKKPVEK